jgi:3-dehydroquinate synthase
MLVIYDHHLLEISDEFRKWIQKFQFRYPVQSGEGLKDLDQFAGHVKKLSQLAEPMNSRKMTVLAVGGGSVGDFAGFFASVFKRGVSLIHIPTTWLAAIDSAHGGKTALNLDSVKNQIGTFYPAKQVVLVRSVLTSQPQALAQDAMGELGKIALIDGGSWVKRLEKSQRSQSDSDLLWDNLKNAIDAKMRVVIKDPVESKGVRQILNLGHTVGHVFETAFGWSHGFSVAQGLFFALEFSEHKGLLSEKEFDRAMRFLSERLGLAPDRPQQALSAKAFTSILSADKKRSGRDDVTFIFLRKFGKVERRSVPIAEIVSEAKRQGWIQSRAR